MWPNQDKEISALKDRVRALESALADARLDLANEKAARLASGLESLKAMELIRGELAKSVAGLRGKREEKPTIVFGDARHFRTAVEAEELIDTIS